MSTSSFPSVGTSRETLVTFVRELLGGNPNPEDPGPPGPWGPVIHAAFERIVTRLGPHPEPWRLGPSPEPWRMLQIIALRHPEVWELFGGGPLAAVGLNPQPLPPAILFSAAIADELIQRAAFAQELANWLPQPAEQRGSVSTGGRVSMYVDELCGNNFKMKFPKPAPPPPWWREELSGVDLVVMGVRFETAAPLAAGEELRRSFSQAGDKLIETGVSRLR